MFDGIPGHWFVLAIIAVGAGGAIAFANDEADIIRAAYQNSITDLKSGKGTFRYSVKSKAEEGNSWVDVENATGSIEFSGDRFLLDLKYDLARRSKFEARKILNDGENLYEAQFSADISATNAQLHVIPVKRDRRGCVAMGIVHFGFDPAHLPQTFCSIPPAQSASEVPGWTVIRESNDSIVYEYGLRNSPNTRIRHRYLRDFGFNMSRRVVLAPGENEDESSNLVDQKWQRIGEMWCLKSVSNTHMLDQLTLRDEFEFTSFEPNAEIDGKWSLQALQMPPGSRILDQRPDVAERIHYIPANDQVLETSLDSIASQIENLATERVTPVNPERGISRTLIIMILGNACLLGLLAVLLFQRWRKSSRS